MLCSSPYISLGQLLSSSGTDDRNRPNPTRPSLRSKQPVASSHTSLIFSRQLPIDCDLPQAERIGFLYQARCGCPDLAFARTCNAQELLDRHHGRIAPCVHAKLVTPSRSRITDRRSFRMSPRRLSGRRSSRFSAIDRSSGNLRSPVSVGRRVNRKRKCGNRSLRLVSSERQMYDMNVRGTPKRL